MKIYRIINDKKYEFELNKLELLTAYYEQEAAYDDEEDVRDWLNEMSDEQLEDFGISRDEANSLIPRIAHQMRYYLDESPVQGEFWYDVREAATDDVFNDFINEKQSGKENSQ